jgi:glycosyltransferase involved in cell wall biosynthesis
MKNKKPKIVLVTGPWSFKNSSAFTNTLNLIDILDPLSSEITWIATNCRTDKNKLPEKINLIGLHLENTNEMPLLEWIISRLLHQIKIILKLIKLKKVDVLIFAYGADLLVLPNLAARFLGKKVIVRSDGRSSVALLKRNYKKANKSKIALWSMIERITYLSANKILPESEYMINFYNLQKYQNKVSIGSKYVNTTCFKKTKELTERIYQIGYVGRLSAEKGVLEFAYSLSTIQKNKKGRVVIIGEGDLKDKIKEILINNKNIEKIELIGWIEHKKIPSYLNDMKLLVLPSYNEGLPSIVPEAMACGTPVLATPVGGIPDLIKDGETGFIMDDNSPACIAENVMRALEHPNLDKIVKNARELVEEEFTYEAVVERYGKILENI